MLEGADFQRICDERLQLRPEARDLASALCEECQSLGSAHVPDLPTGFGASATPVPATPGQVCVCLCRTHGSRGCKQVPEPCLSQQAQSNKQDADACRTATLLYLTKKALQALACSGSSQPLANAGEDPQLTLTNILLSCNLRYSFDSP